MPASEPETASQHSFGLVCGIIAYGCWGLYPLYFILLQSVSPFEVVANRIAWSLLLLLVVLSMRHRWSAMRRTLQSRKSVALLAIAAIMISINWGVYAYSINIGAIVEVSLAYFITPLVSVMLAVILLRERLRPAQWTATTRGAIAGVVVTISYGHPPWISLILSVSFGAYGLARKVASVGAVEGLAIETVLLMPAAFIIMILFIRSPEGAFASGTPTIIILLILLGPITTTPLLAFGAAAERIPLSTLGLLQFLTPTIQFILGLAVFHAVVSPARWVGVSIIWIALVVFSWDAARHARRVAAHTEASSVIDELEVSVPD